MIVIWHVLKSCGKMAAVVHEMDDSDINVYLPGYDTVKCYTQAALRAVSAAVKAADHLFASEREFGYYDSFSSFHSMMQERGKNLLTIISALAKSQGIHQKLENFTTEEAFGILLDANKLILENFDTALDEANGKISPVNLVPEELVVSSIRTRLPINTSWNRTNSPVNNERTYKLLSANNIVRPQFKFKEKVDNSNTVFVPLIKDKPNSIKPLAILLETSEGKEEFSHPYEWEIEKFQPRNEVLEISEPVLPKGLTETPLMYVENEEDLMKMFEELRKETEFAIDLEHHSYRSFQGFVCLMQISTRKKDYIIDTLKLRMELQVLNEIFTDPKVLKVLHGADMDIVWLQRDFGLYIVNMFDTGQAARVLNFPHFSLAYLLEHYCKKNADKQFQLADWRIRPLFPEMMKYAREDTHYLLYILDCMKNDLLQKGNKQKNLLLAVYDRSKHVCLKKYEKPLFQDNSYLSLYKKSKKVFNSKQLLALKEIFAWRDKCAREDDESIGYVLPDHMLLQIAEVLPREQQGLLACCNPVPQTVRRELGYLHSILLTARDSVIPEFLESEQPLRIPEISIDIDLDNVLHCVHDIRHDDSCFPGEMEIDTLEKGFETILKTKEKPSLQILEENPCFVEQDVLQNYDVATKSYLCPNERYNIVKKLPSTQKFGEAETETVSDSRQAVMINNHLKQLAAVSETEKISTVKAKGNLSVIASQDHTESEISKIEDTPLRKKEKKKRKKTSHLKPDVPLNKDLEDRTLPKKIKTPEALDFRPFDYQTARSKMFDEVRKNKRAITGKNVFEPGNSGQDYQTPGKSWGKKRKDCKQASFNRDGQKSGSSCSRDWPKR